MSWVQFWSYIPLTCDWWDRQEAAGVERARKAASEARAEAQDINQVRLQQQILDPTEEEVAANKRADEANAKYSELSQRILKRSASKRCRWFKWQDDVVPENAEEESRPSRL